MTAIFGVPREEYAALTRGRDDLPGRRDKLETLIANLQELLDDLPKSTEAAIARRPRTTWDELGKVEAEIAAIEAVVAAYCSSK